MKSAFSGLTVKQIPSPQDARVQDLPGSFFVSVYFSKLHLLSVYNSKIIPLLTIGATMFQTSVKLDTYMELKNNYIDKYFCCFLIVNICRASLHHLA